MQTAGCSHRDGGTLESAGCLVSLSRKQRSRPRAHRQSQKKRHYLHPPPPRPMGRRPASGHGSPLLQLPPTRKRCPPTGRAVTSRHRRRGRPPQVHRGTATALSPGASWVSRQACRPSGGAWRTRKDCCCRGRHRRRPHHLRYRYRCRAQVEEGQGAAGPRHCLQQRPNPPVAGHDEKAVPTCGHGCQNQNRMPTWTWWRGSGETGADGQGAGVHQGQQWVRPSTVRVE